MNRHYWKRDYRGFVDWHSVEMFPEPHSTKAIDDGIEWGLQTDARTLTLEMEAPASLTNLEEAEALARGLRCPVLIIHGDKDMCQPSARAKRLAALTGGRLVNLKGAGHMPHVRHPVILNLLIKDFVDSLDRAFDPTGKGTGHARARG